MIAIVITLAFKLHDRLLKGLNTTFNINPSQIKQVSHIIRINKQAI